MAIARRTFTVHDYHRMREAGVFAEDDRIELLDGEIIEMSPISPLHAAIVKRINMLLSQRAMGQYLISIQDPVQLSDRSEPQPDIALLREHADFYATAHPTPADILLIIEVAESLEYDRDYKLLRYAQSAIAEVWIVNIDQRQIQQYDDPAHGQYRREQTWLPGQTITSTALPSLTLHIDTIFG